MYKVVRLFQLRQPLWKATLKRNRGLSSDTVPSRFSSRVSGKQGLSGTWRRPHARTISLPFETGYLFCLYSNLLIDGHVKFNYNNRMYIRL